MIKLTKRHMKNEIRYCLSRAEYEIHLSLYPHTDRSKFAAELLSAKDIIRRGFR